MIALSGFSIKKKYLVILKNEENTPDDNPRKKDEFLHLMNKDIPHKRKNCCI